MAVVVAVQEVVVATSTVVSVAVKVVEVEVPRDPLTPTARRTRAGAAARAFKGLSQKRVPVEPTCNGCEQSCQLLVM